MKEYICKSCQAKYYSSASLDQMVNPYCEVCGGEIEESEEEERKNEN